MTMRAEIWRPPVSYAPRRWLLLVFFAVLALILASRAVWLQLLNNDFLQRHGEARAVRIVPVPAQRGVITDRNGEYLAISTPIQSLWCEPRQLLRHPQGLVALTRVLNMDPGQLTRRLEQRRGRDFFWLRRHVPPELARRVLTLGIPGVHGDREYRRYYPVADVATHVVGFTDVDGVGREGMEMAYNTWLSGSPGEKRVLRDRLGRIVEHIENVAIRRPGRSLALSIDLRIQYAAWRELQAALQRYRARSASLVMLDVQSGEVLAMISLPAYNPNHRRGAMGARYRNRSVTDVFEPGSTMKPFTVLAALESGEYAAHSPVDTHPGHFRIAGHTIRDIRNYGMLDVATVLSKSSNVGISRIALSLTPVWHWPLLSRLGFGQVTGSAFPGEVPGRLPGPELRSAVERATLAFGYGMSVNALQLVRAYAAIANGGVMTPVSLVRQDGEVVGQRIVSESRARGLVTMMEAVVSAQGTGKRAAVGGYRVAGKTGTVHKSDRSGYRSDRYLSLFAGLAPVSQPRLAMVVVIDEPQGAEYYGGLVAAPVFSRVMAGALRIMNIAPDDRAAYTTVYTAAAAPAPTGSDGGP